jgi:hypothetical protein
MTYLIYPCELCTSCPPPPLPYKHCKTNGRLTNLGTWTPPLLLPPPHIKRRVISPLNKYLEQQCTLRRGLVVAGGGGGGERRPICKDPPTLMA